MAWVGGSLRHGGVGKAKEMEVSIARGRAWVHGFDAGPTSMEERRRPRGMLWVVCGLLLARACGCTKERLALRWAMHGGEACAQVGDAWRRGCARGEATEFEVNLDGGRWPG